MGSQEKVEMIDAVTYVFTTNNTAQKDQKGKIRTRMRIWQIVPFVCASMCCIPYGLMLGWPSPTYPKLLRPDSPIPISYDQSAMVAGFLMIGNVLGAPISATNCLGPKYGILVGILSMACGWLAMWQARNILWLLASRLLIGLGHAFSVGQLRLHVTDTCDADVATALLKPLNLHVLAAAMAAYIAGPSLDLRQFAVAALLAAAGVFLVCLPMLRPWAGSETERCRSGGLMDVFRQRALRGKLAVFAFLVFCQQGSGAPATLVYTQILFERSRCPHAAYLAVGYAGLVLASSVLGTYLVPRYNKRTVLLLSSCGVALLILAKICVIFYRVNEVYWSYTSVAVMYSYIVVHTLGLGSVPVTFIPEFFPKECRTSVTQFFTMFHSILALVITKIFQVLMTKYDVGVGFCLFLCVSVVAVVFVYFVVPNKVTDAKSDVFVKNLQ